MLKVLEVLEMLKVMKVFVNPTLIWNRVAVVKAASDSMGQLRRKLWLCHALQCVPGAWLAHPQHPARLAKMSDISAQKAHIDSHRGHPTLTTAAP